MLTGLLCLTGVTLIGLFDYWADYWADYRMLFTVLYVLPIGFATLYVNRLFAVFLAALSVVLWTGGDIVYGVPSPGTAIRLWNDGIILSLFLIVIYLLDALRLTLADLEAKVESRTRALRVEMEERRYLQNGILDLTEKERQSFGHDLHDVVCQDLASIAIAGHLLAKKLRTEQHTREAEKAREIAEMVDHALTKARSVARGFFTAGFDVEGLVESLNETARSIQERHGIHCEIRWPDHLTIANEDVVMHFFRIAQEAIQNAVRHARATRIEVSLKRVHDTVQLVIADNGVGLVQSQKSRSGLGLRIMSYRAGIIGGDFRIENPESGGTRIVCEVPRKKLLGKPGRPEPQPAEKPAA
jgi:signal transduction histidine kinase